ncbi:hypothetical protein PoB_006955100 [Plakobranchus ocellatus]|uniref:Uncharacterized protein n=1 Tax=Plakobranchus ocellatus TaxID=259542 RepID=A0AAV4DFW0_9GAST|nr:hypothetical protein PoB_006955100 [Plakobranchus ocellatus]
MNAFSTTDTSGDHAISLPKAVSAVRGSFYQPAKDCVCSPGITLSACQRLCLQSGDHAISLPKAVSAVRGSCYQPPIGHVCSSGITRCTFNRPCLLSWDHVAGDPEMKNLLKLQLYLDDFKDALSGT